MYTGDGIFVVCCVFFVVSKNFLYTSFPDKILNLLWSGYVSLKNDLFSEYDYGLTVIIYLAFIIPKF